MKPLSHFSFHAVLLSVLLLLLLSTGCRDEFPDEDRPLVNLVEDGCYDSDQVVETTEQESEGSFYFQLPDNIPNEFSLAVVHNMPSGLKGKIVQLGTNGSIDGTLQDFSVQDVAEIISISLPEGENRVLAFEVEGSLNTPYEPSVAVVAIRDYEEGGSCGTNKSQRLVISRPKGNAQEAADESGLPVVQACQCSNNQLVAVEVPYGIDVETLRPKTRERVTQALTDSLIGVDFDFEIDIPDFIEVISDTDQEQLDFSIHDDGSSCIGYDGSSAPSVDPNQQAFTVAFVDSGYDLANHEGSVADHRYRVTPPPCFTNSISEYGYDLINDASDPQDEVGHGTDVASAFLGKLDVSVPVSVLHLKFFGKSGASYFDALCASYAASKTGAKIINWSWGFRADAMPKSLEHLLGYLKANDVIAVAAAGNYRESLDSVPLYPASASSQFDNLITVGSYVYPNVTDDPPTPQRASFSNYSNSIADVAAYASVSTLRYNFPGSYNLVAGTSISAPLVSQKLTEIWATNPNRKYPEVLLEFNNALSTQGTALINDVAGGKYLPNGCSYE
ncbi:MAG: S8 family serine peptidase [Bacteroidota bacterium]